MRFPFAITALATLLVASACKAGDVSNPGGRPAVALRIRPDGGAFNVGEPSDFTAAFLDADGTELGMAKSATWSSSDPTVATIDRAGHFVARCVGNTNIVAVASVGDQTVSGHRLVTVSTAGQTCAAH